MRTRFIVSSLALLLTGCSVLRADQTIDTRKQSFPAAGVARARLQTGAGFLVVHGKPGTSTIDVDAEFRAPSSADPKRVLERLKLTMEVRGDTFYLKSDQEDGSWMSGASGSIDITIMVPTTVNLDIEDGSGSISVVGAGADVRIEDGSGDIEVSHVGGNLRIEDGSGGITVSDVGQSVEIEDGSGGIEVRHVGRDVRISDGSGSVEIEDVKGNLDIPTGGSGSVHYRDVKGQVNVPRKR